VCSSICVPRSTPGWKQWEKFSILIDTNEHETSFSYTKILFPITSPFQKLYKMLIMLVFFSVSMSISSSDHILLEGICRQAVCQLFFLYFNPVWTKDSSTQHSTTTYPFNSSSHVINIYPCYSIHYCFIFTFVKDTNNMNNTISMHAMHVTRILLFHKVFAFFTDYLKLELCNISTYEFLVCVTLSK